MLRQFMHDTVVAHNVQLTLWHISSQFPSESDESVELDITPEQLAAKNEKVRGWYRYHV